ncbi:circadian clock protein KaiC [Pararhodospirillum photometricum]|uniref:non-specific serine/threonine protein kinase n=1 Tax=Pararhodospirillum photometricum DSM 122 TaxID=1150469 RepID=H6SP02_PARPM|nr:circadian clock protein KaiC [Pararhodospirillum photometricum]CCG07074.1 Circadian clock protein KaiC [Pararhodospirillum photometricum DSM 122]
MKQPSANEIEKQSTGIPGFDLIAYGGLPKGRTTLLVGTAGSAKTIFSVQFLAAGIEQFGQGAVFVTFEEMLDDIRHNVAGFGWNIERWEAEGNWAFVDAAPRPLDDGEIVGAFDLGALLARIEHAVRTTNAKRVVLDSLGAVFIRLGEASTLRNELLRISAALKVMGVTTIMTAERESDEGPLTRQGIEEFVADNVVILRNVKDGERRRRTCEILKFRGAFHQKGEFPFAILPGSGIQVIPLSAIELRQSSSELRIPSGSADLDEMCGGGFFRDSIVLVSGATGTGKTLMCTHFLNGGLLAGERCLLFAFEESRQQLFRNASGWGVDFKTAEESGRLRVVCDYPEVASIEDHMITIKQIIEDFKPDRLAIDSLSAIERISSDRGFREFVIGLTSFIKHGEIATLFTSNTPTLMGGSSVTETHISSITDSIILLRYVETFGEISRGVMVLKMRGSFHDKEIREFNIDGKGMHIGRPFRNMTGILAGNPHHVTTSEADRLEGLFTEGPR